MTGSDALHTHLETGITTVCRAWLLERRDGTQFGFTDHDLPLVFEETTFDANGGLTAGSLLQTSGLAIDNTEALGALSDERITEDDISAGLYDGAQVTAWLVNWADVTARKIMFRGTIGEIRRGDGRFEAELRGLTEVLNQPQGRSYLKSCSAVLGDGACGVDLTAPGVSVQLPLVEILNRQTLVFDDVGGHEDGWFARGFVTVVDGAGAGVSGVVKSDLREDGRRSLTLWEPLRAPVAVGDVVRLTAGCDKAVETCRARFDNVANFQGFPFIPGDDWMTAVPRQGGENAGGRLV